MIIVKICGGLGNQLFQYGFGKYLSRLLNTKVKFDVQTTRNNKNFTSRDLEPAIFNSITELASKDEIREMKLFTKGFFERLERKIIEKLPFMNNAFYVEKPFSKESKIQYFKDNCYYDGYWQSFKYLDNIDRAFIKEDAIKSNLDAQNAALLKDILIGQSIGLHIRRGDYLSNKKNASIFEVCSLNYYQRAVQYFTEMMPESVYYIFSDDIMWAKKNLTGNQFIHVENKKPLVDLYLMSKCKHNIISNSTFSWWASWINQNPDKRIIAPKLWYKGKLNESTFELIPDNWKRI